LTVVTASTSTWLSVAGTTDGVGSGSLVGDVVGELTGASVAADSVCIAVVEGFSELSLSCPMTARATRIPIGMIQRFFLYQGLDEFGAGCRGSGWVQPS
jgi:hypothetical protein